MSARGRIPSDDPKSEAGRFDRSRSTPAPAPAAAPAAKPALDPQIQSQLMSVALYMAKRKSDVMPLFERVFEEWRERAAIRQYLNDGMSRWNAELYALEDAAEMLGVRFK